MNTMLPPPRELPPHRHERIRTELLREVTGVRRTSRRPALVLAATALSVVALLAAVVWMAGPRAAVEPIGAGGGPTRTGGPTKIAEPGATGPVLAGLSAEEQQAIESGCGESAFGADRSVVPATPDVIDTWNTVRLYNLLTDQAGKLALLYGQHAALNCVVGGPAMPYNSGFSGGSGFEPPAGPVVVDISGASAGGDIPGNKSIYRGQRGSETVAGRISAEVARVTLTQGGQTVTAVLANGTFLGRILHPSTWLIPKNLPRPVVRAYNAGGTLLGTG